VEAVSPREISHAARASLVAFTQEIEALLGGEVR
jgi:hypothetical protein